jgi:hypothetical protein
MAAIAKRLANEPILSGECISASLATRRPSAMALYGALAEWRFAAHL